MRIGHGYDVHRLVRGRRCVLCGVEIPFELGPDGHSDADVPVHALMDAMLGAAAMGDIGRLFPDTDDAYKDADSIMLLREVVGRLQDCGMRVSNADITIIAQAPKLSPYIDKMRENIETALEAEPGSVNVKATTEEKLGFTGEKKGIAAHAVVLMEEIR